MHCSRFWVMMRHFVVVVVVMLMMITVDVGARRREKSIRSTCNLRWKCARLSMKILRHANAQRCLAMVGKRKSELKMCLAHILLALHTKAGMSKWRQSRKEKNQNQILKQSENTCEWLRCRLKILIIDGKKSAVVYERCEQQTTTSHIRKTHDHDTYTRVRQQAAKAARWWCFSASRAHESCWGMCKRNMCELYTMFWDNLGNGLLMVFEVVSSDNFFLTSPAHFTALCFFVCEILKLALAREHE